MPRPEVIVTSSFDDVARGIDRGVKRALGRTAAVGVAAARAAPTAGYGIASITHATKAAPVTEDARGWEAPIVNPDFRARFFEYGTLGRRGKKTKRPRKQPTTTTAGKRRGIRPVRFLAAGRKAAARALIANLQRELGG